MDVHTQEAPLEEAIETRELVDGELERSLTDVSWLDHREICLVPGSDI